MTKKITRVLLLCAAALVLFCIFCIILLDFQQKKSSDTVIGFIMPGSIDETGWNGMHYQGISQASKCFDVKLSVKENVPEEGGLCQEKMKELVKEGAQLIILSSYSYNKDVEILAKDYPEVTFFICSSYDSQKENVKGYFIRMYQARYLSGVLAGMRTHTNEIGYVAAMETEEVIRGINAFTLGVHRVNPKAKVIVSFTGVWEDEEKEKQTAKELMKNRQIDLITYHQNQPYVIEEAESAGIESIGYHEKVDGFSDKYLTAVGGNWKLAYEEMIRAYLQGKVIKSNLYWLGIEKAVVELLPYSDLVSTKERNEIQKVRQDILNGKDVFEGKICDTEGKIRCNDGERISDEMLMSQMDWFVEGVEIYEK